MFATKTPGVRNSTPKFYYIVGEGTKRGQPPEWFPQEPHQKTNKEFYMNKQYMIVAMTSENIKKVVATNKTLQEASKYVSIINEGQAEALKRGKKSECKMLVVEQPSTISVKYFETKLAKD
jgi:hypothetical protein